MERVATALWSHFFQRAAQAIAHRTRSMRANAWRSRHAVMTTFLLISMLAGGCGQPAVAPEGSLEAFTNHLDERLPQLMDRYDVPGASMALVQNGELVWLGAYGYADRKRRHEMTTDAVFRAESISKPVTAWGVMLLVEEGRIELDDPVEQYVGDAVLPESEYDERQVTVRRLLSNSAGLPLGPIGADAEYAPGSDMPSLRAYVSQEARLTRAPGTAFEYSNVGYNTLGLLVEAVTGRDFAAYMADSVLIPLGMHQSSFAWSDTLRAAMPVGYELDGSPVPAYVYAANASGGLLSTAEDVAHFIRAEMAGSYSANEDGLSPTSVRELHMPQVDVPGLFGWVAEAYGLGHFVETLPSGQRAVWHGGQGHGWMTHFHAVPEAGDGIVILTNSERSWPLMAHVLSDWARWSGFGSVKFSRITSATTALWMLTGLIALVGLVQALRLAHAWHRGHRRWAPWSRAERLRRGLQAALGTGIIAALAWGAAQPYLFATSIFPNAAGWAGAALAVLGSTLLLSALCPYSDD